MRNQLRLEVIYPFQLPWTSMVTFCLKALVHLCAKMLKPRVIQVLVAKRLFIYELATKDAATAAIRSQLSSFPLAKEHRG